MMRTFLVPFAAATVIAAALSSCSSTPATMRTRMQQWAASTDVNYVAAESAISSDLSGIAAGLRLHDFQGVQTDCQGFYDDVGTIYGGLPAPDAAVTNDLNEAVNTYWLPGALACERATGLGSSGITTLQRDLQRGNVLYAQAERLIHGFGIN